ncbi:MAG: hypothetical protein D6741_20035, partial [Planctomycetota bacterium]
MMRHRKSIPWRACERAVVERSRAGLRLSIACFVRGLWGAAFACVVLTMSLASAQSMPFPSPIPETQATPPDARRPRFDQPVGNASAGPVPNAGLHGGGAISGEGDGGRVVGPSASAVTPVALDGQAGARSSESRHLDQATPGEDSPRGQPAATLSNGQAPLPLRPR